MQNFFIQPVVESERSWKPFRSFLRGFTIVLLDVNGVRGRYVEGATTAAAPMRR